MEVVEDGGIDGGRYKGLNDSLSAKIAEMGIATARYALRKLVRRVKSLSAQIRPAVIWLQPHDFSIAVRHAEKN